MQPVRRYGLFVLAMLAGLSALYLQRASAQEEPHQHAVGEDDPETLGSEDAHDHAGHDHDAEHDDHEVHDDHDDHAGHDHEAALIVELSPAERDMLGVIVATAVSGKLTTHIRLPGELVLNADRVAHIVPRAPGIVREVLVSVGDTVHTSDVMAWFESAALGRAKVDYVSKWAARGSSAMDLVRAREVHHNTARLLGVLDSAPSLETLRETEVGSMGENRSILISSYAELVFAKAAYLRERPLLEKKIASEQDFQASEAEYKKADALYAATRDSVEFKIRRDLMEAERTQQVREIEEQGARRHLYVLGLTSEEIVALELLAKRHMHAGAREAMCDDPDCQPCQQAAANRNDDVAVETYDREADEKLAWYPLRAPFDGTVIEKHLTLGEKHSDDSGAFTIADLGSVWANIAVYQKDLLSVRKGMAVTISVGGDRRTVHGDIAYLSPIVDKKTRTALARVVLPNPDGQLRPGLFVTGEIAVGQEHASIIIPKSAVQRMDQDTIVFLKTGNGFTPTPVTPGRSNGSHIEILSGLTAGQRYVTRGAFELKAKIVTRGLDPHAGHGH